MNDNVPKRSGLVRPGVGERAARSEKTLSDILEQIAQMRETIADAREFLEPHVKPGTGARPTKA